MSTIFDEVKTAESVQRAELLTKYRSLLTTDEPPNAESLLDVIQRLGFQPSRTLADALAVQLAEKLKQTATDTLEAQADLEKATTRPPWEASRHYGRRIR